MTDFKCLVDLSLSWPYMHRSLCKGRAYTSDLTWVHSPIWNLLCVPQTLDPIPLGLFLFFFFPFVYSVQSLTQNNRISFSTLQTKWITAPTLKIFLNTCWAQKLDWPSRNSRVGCAHGKPRVEWVSFSDTGQTWILFFLGLWQGHHWTKPLELQQPCFLIFFLMVSNVGKYGNNCIGNKGFPTVVINIGRRWPELLLSHTKTI